MNLGINHNSMYLLLTEKLLDKHTSWQLPPPSQLRVHDAPSGQGMVAFLHSYLPPQVMVSAVVGVGFSGKFIERQAQSPSHVNDPPPSINGHITFA